MNGEKKFIAIDLGAENGRCVVVTLKDGKVDLKEVYRFTTHAVSLDSGLHWDILRIFDDVVTGLAKARLEFGQRFDGIGVDTWGVDYVLLDAEGRVIGYPYHYRDNRTDGMMEQTFGMVPEEEMYKRTGVQFAQINTVFQLESEKKRKTNFLSVADKMLMTPDFISYLLSGTIFAEYTIASTTGLTDPVNKDWAIDLIEKLRLPGRLFPRIVMPGNIIGRILPSLARRTGLDSGTPIIATASHDTASAVVSVPDNSREDWAFLSSGTWTLVGAETLQPYLTVDAMRYNFTNEGGAAGTTRLLKNIMGLWPLQEARRFWLEKGEEFSYSALVDLAEEEGPSNSWIDLNDSRFLKPGSMPDKISAFLEETGQTTVERIGFFTRVILESLAFSSREVVKEIEALTGRSVKVVHAVGGGIRNTLLMQLTADALGIPLVAGPVEGTVVGNAGVQALAIGAISGIDEWREIIARSFETLTYRPKNGDYFDHNEEAFLRVSSGGKA